MQLRVENKKRIFEYLRMEWIAVFILFLVIFSTYYQSLFNNFVNLDDYGYVPENQYIRNLSLEGIYKIFTRPIIGNYFPLQILSYALDYQFWHIQPFGYHLTNIVLHIVNAILVFFLLKKMFSNPLVSFLAALFFGLHPINVESVTWIAERKNVLSTFFFLSSYLTYLYYNKEEKRVRRRGFYIMALLLFLLALFTKVSAVVLPILLMLYDFCFLRKKWWNSLQDKIPFLLLSIIFSVITVWVYHSGQYLVDYHGGSFYFNTLAMVNVIVEYIIYLIAPFYLDNYYITPIPKSFFESQVMFSLAAILLFGLLAWISLRKNRILLFWLGWFGIALLPMLNIVPIAILRADRYMYLPAIGFYYLISLGIAKICEIKPRLYYYTACFLSIVVIAGSYSFLTIERNKIWKDTNTLWLDNLKKFPDNSRAFSGIGGYFLDQGKVDKAITYLQNGLLVDPQNVPLMNSLSKAYRINKMYDKAEDLSLQAIQLDPNDSDSYNGLGAIYYDKGEMEKAEQYFTKAIRINPDNWSPHTNLGVIYFKNKLFDEAIQEFEKGIQLSPDQVGAYVNLALAYENKQLPEKAVLYLNRALDYFPDSHTALFHLGRLYFNQRNFVSAHFYLREALRLNPEDGGTNYYLGLLAQASANYYFQKARETNLGESKGLMSEALIEEQFPKGKGR